MSNLLGTSAAKLSSLMASHGSVSVTYYQSGSAALSLVATPRRGDGEYVSEDGTINTVVEPRDYIVSVSDLPQKARDGNVFKETIGGVLRSYEVLPDGARPSCELWDAAGTKWVIRTKRVG